MAGRCIFISCSKLTCYWIPWCKPRKGFLPLLTSGIYRRPAVCLQDLFDATRKSSATCIWRTHLGLVWARCVVEAGAGGNRKTKDPPESVKGSCCPEQTSGGMPQWTSKPSEKNVKNREKPQHKSDLLTWRRTCEALSEFFFKHIGGGERSQAMREERQKSDEMGVMSFMKENKAPKPSRSN